MCMCVCAHVRRACAYVHVHVHARVRVHVHMRAHVRVHVRVRVHMCVHVHVIFRSQDVFPPKGEMTPYKYQRKWCHIIYKYQGRCEDSEGICLYRFVSGEAGGPWQWAELRDKPGMV